MAILYDQPFSAEEEASINIDALVNDNENELIRRTPMSGHFLEQTRRATPTIPPGFSAPVVSKPSVDEQRAQPMSRNASSGITPVVPAIPTTPIRTATPVRSKKGKQEKHGNETGDRSTSMISASLKSQPETPTKSAKAKTQRVADDASTAGLREGKEKNSSQSPLKSTPKAKSVGKKNDNISTTPGKEIKDTVVPAATPNSTKRQNPGKLNIAAAIKPTEIDSSAQKVDAQSKNVRAVPTPASSVPSSAAVSTGSPVKRSGPLTLRVLATPKTEVPPPLSASSVTSLPHVPTVDRLRSRQASIASIQQPGTPASELISDTASVTSASISRASSPPLVSSKVGSAPVRKKTKSQAKKERQERKRQIEEEQAMALDEHKSDTEVIQAPIVGRKKKTKKPASNPKPAASASAAAAAPPQPPPTAAKSQPTSPKTATVEEEQETPPISTTPVVPAPKKAQTTKPPPSITDSKDASQESSKDKRELSAQSIIADLQKSGELLVSTLEFFKPLSSSLAHSTRAQSGSPTAPPDLKIHFSEADLDALAKKKPVRLHNQDSKGDSRTLITPQGKFFWGLTQELEEKALELEKQIEELKGHARFHPRKHSPHTQNHNLGAQAQSPDALPAIATALKEAGKKLGSSAGSPQGHPMPLLDPTATLLGSTSLPLPPVQPAGEGVPQPPPTPQPQTPADAGSYLNQFVLPKTDSPSPNQPRTEMAAVGGPPGAGTANMSVHPRRFAKAAKAVVEGGAVGSTEIDGMGMMAADLLGGVVVQGLEALVGAGLGFNTTHDFGMDEHGHLTLGRGVLDVQGLVNAMESSGGLGFGGNQSARRGRGSVLSVEEAEQAMLTARKEHEALEKKLTALMKKNKRLVSGAGKA